MLPSDRPIETLFHDTWARHTSVIHTHIPLVLCLVLSSLNMQAGDSLQNAPCSLLLCFSRNWTLVWEIGPSHSTSSPKINGRKLPCIFQHGIVNLHLWPMCVLLLLYPRQCLPGTLEEKLYLTYSTVLTDIVKLISRSQSLLSLFMLGLSNYVLMNSEFISLPL